MVGWRWITQKNFGQRSSVLFFDCPTDFSFGSVQAEAGNPRNPTVVLFLKIPRVLCSHPLTGGPGIILIINILFAPSIRVEPRCFRVVPESFHRLDVAIGKAVVASFVVTQGR